jgi:hypothetical protein
MSTVSSSLPLPSANPAAAAPTLVERPAAGRIYTPLPRMWIGLILAGLCLICQLLGAYVEELVYVFGLAGTCYWLFCVHRIHKVLCEFTRAAYPISPRRAVGFQFIPLYKYYWFFRWTSQLAEFLNQQPGARAVPRFWPGLVLTVASLFGWFPWFKSARLFLIFGLGMYFVRQLHAVLPDCRPICLKRLQQWNLSLSAGVGATFSFVLVQALLDFSSEKRIEKLHELAAIFFVSVGVVIFLEPLFEKLRAVLGVVDHHPVLHSHKPWRLRFAVFLILVFTSLFHGLMHSEIEGRITYDLSGTLTMLLTGMLVSGGITYFWIAAAHRHPPHAWRSGLISGAVLGFIVASTVITAVTPATAPPAGTGSSSAPESVIKDLQEGKIKGAIAKAVPPEYPFVPRRVVKDVEDGNLGNDSGLTRMGLIAFPWPIFGLIGGLVIDRRWTRIGGGGVVPTVAVSLFVVALLYGLGLWRMKQVSSLGEMLCHLSVVAGWGLALIIGSSANILTPEDTADSGLQTVD